MTKDDAKEKMKQIRDNENQKMDSWYDGLGSGNISLDGTYTPEALRAIADLIDDLGEI